MADLATGKVLGSANLVVIHQEMAQLILAGELLVDRGAGKAAAETSLVMPCAPVIGSSSDATSGPDIAGSFVVQLTLFAVGMPDLSSLAVHHTGRSSAGSSQAML